MFNIGEGWQGAAEDDRRAAEHDSSLFDIGEGWQEAAKDDWSAAEPWGGAAYTRLREAAYRTS